MKILHAFDFYLPQTMNWAYGLLAHTPGVEQWIAAPWMVKGPYMPDRFRYFIRPLQRIKGLLPNDEWQLFQLGQWLIRLEYQIPLYANWLEKQIKNQKPDLIHTHFGPVGCRILPLSKPLGIPLVASFYGYDFLRIPFEKPKFREKYRRLFEAAAGVTTTGPNTPDLLIRQGCPAHKIHPVPLGVNLADFAPDYHNKPKNSLKLVQMATITAKKGYLDTLTAFFEARKTCPGLQLTLAGEIQDLALAAAMRACIAREDPPAAIRWMPAVPQDRVAAFLQEFDVLIHPSYLSEKKDSEGSPVVILEAQALGLPVISTFHADIPAQVKDGETGLLYPECSPERLAAGIRRFYEMENDEFQGFSRQARAHMETAYDLKEMGLQLLAVYEKCLKSK